MREYINLHQLDILNGELDVQVFFPVSMDSKAYRVSLEQVTESTIKSIDFTQALFNANKLQDIDVDLDSKGHNKVLTYIEATNTLELKHMDINFLIRNSKYQPNKFLRTGNDKSVYTDNIYIMDIVVNESSSANKVIQVDNTGSTLTYADMDVVVNKALKNNNLDFEQKVLDEEIRATEEEKRIEQLVKDEELRATQAENVITQETDRKISEIERYTKHSIIDTIAANSSRTITTSELGDPESCLDTVLQITVKDPVQSSSTYNTYINSEGVFTIGRTKDNITIINESEYDLEFHLFVVVF